MSRSERFARPEEKHKEARMTPAVIAHWFGVNSKAEQKAELS
ncbi:hypothetical protein [Hyperthermus butylicus]|nr:hypothetical protein [Hyperthermus butylicus]